MESDNYILHDESIENEYKFTLREAVEKAKDHKLFENHIILFASKFKSPPMNELKGNYCLLIIFHTNLKKLKSQFRNFFLISEKTRM